ncbi:MAG TPA: SRPBCC family protein [Bacteroidia bacterium]|jgi:uncharacterized protein YndB with AHSA1/START domain|nr:SRPBCC family protein [Bacteroidia bacterium]
MTILSIIFLSLVGLIVLLLVIGLFLKKAFHIERSILINKSKPEVYNYLRILKNGEHFNKWTMTDPNMKKTLTGTDGTVGFTYAWDSTNKNVGAGAQEIIKLKENARIDYELRFERPFKNTAFSSLILDDATPGQTKVTWTFHGVMPYPFNLIHALLGLSKMLGKDLEISLLNLKKQLEK